MGTSGSDVIDHLLGHAAAARLRPWRDMRPQTREQAQASYLALFSPAQTPAGPFDLKERMAVAAFVAALHEQPSAAKHYVGLLAAQDAGLAATVAEEALGARTEGPYGDYREEGLHGESRSGLRYRPSDSTRSRLGERLSAAFEHAHLLLFRPREADADAIQRLRLAGWGADQIVGLSQLVAFLTFQIRVLVGLSLLAERLGPDGRAAATGQEVGR